MFSFFRRKKMKKLGEIAGKASPAVNWLALDIKMNFIPSKFLRDTYSRGYIIAFIESTFEPFASELKGEDKKLLSMTLCALLIEQLRELEDGLPLDQNAEIFYFESIAKHVSPDFKRGARDGKSDLYQIQKIESSSIAQEFHRSKIETSTTHRQERSSDLRLVKRLKRDLGDSLPIATGIGTKDDPIVITAAADYVSIEYLIARHILQGVDHKFEKANLLQHEERVIDQLVFLTKEQGSAEWSSRTYFHFDITIGFAKLRSK